MLLSFFFLLALTWTINGIAAKSKKSIFALLVFVVVIPLLEALVSVISTALLPLIGYENPIIGMLYALCGITEFPADFVIGYGAGIIGPHFDEYIMGFRIGNLTFAFPFEFLTGTYERMYMRMTVGLAIIPLFFILNLIGSVLGLALQPPLARLWGRLKIMIPTDRYKRFHFLAMLGTTAIIITILIISVVVWAYWYHYPFYYWNFP